MSNFQCPHCGMTNIDCGRDGYKTPKEIKYEKILEEIEEQIEDIISEKCSKPCEECTGKPLCDKYYILQLIKQAKESEE